MNCGNRRPPLCISTPGLYKFIVRSREPEARKFQHWVTGVVLPAMGTLDLEQVRQSEYFFAESSLFRNLPQIAQSLNPGYCTSPNRPWLGPVCPGLGIKTY